MSKPEPTRLTITEMLVLHDINTQVMMNCHRLSESLQTLANAMKQAGSKIDRSDQLASFIGQINKFDDDSQKFNTQIELVCRSMDEQMLRNLGQKTGGPKLVTP